MLSAGEAAEAAANFPAPSHSQQLPVNYRPDIHSSAPRCRRRAAQSAVVPRIRPSRMQRRQSRQPACLRSITARLRSNRQRCGNAKIRDTRCSPAEMSHRQIGRPMGMVFLQPRATHVATIQPFYQPASGTSLRRPSSQHTKRTRIKKKRKQNARKAQLS